MIAIKGMGIPEKCIKCPMCKRSGIDVYCGVDYVGIDNAFKKRENCPLTEIITCKDCKHWQRVKDYHGRCKLFDEVWKGNSLVPIEHGTNEEFYCQMAERRE